jgi:hypothetical protein
MNSPTTTTKQPSFQKAQRIVKKPASGFGHGRVGQDTDRAENRLRPRDRCSNSIGVVEPRLECNR